MLGQAVGPASKALHKLTHRHADSDKNLSNTTNFSLLRSAETAGAATDTPAAALPAEVGASWLDPPFAASFQYINRGMLSFYNLLRSINEFGATTMHQTSHLCSTGARSCLLHVAAYSNW